MIRLFLAFLLVVAVAVVAQVMPAGPPAPPRNVNLTMLPDGTLTSALDPQNFTYLNGSNDWSKIVANNNTVYVLHPVQTKDEKKNYTYDPWTIGEVLGYLFEVEEFGGVTPPSGQYTVELMGKPIPTRWVRSAVLEEENFKRGAMIFTKRAIPRSEEKTMKATEEKKEENYWNDLLSQDQFV